MREPVGLRITITAVTLTLAACGGAEDSAPITCSPDERTGTYLASYETVSGNCGDIPDTVGRIDGIEQGLVEGCALDAPDRWSADACKLERAYTCAEPGIGAGVTSKWVAVSTQETDDGSRITSSSTVRVLNPDGTQSCVGTYRTVAVRQ